MEPKSLEPLRAVITGGSSGIGLATAQEVVRRGGRVVVCARQPEPLAAAATLLGPAARTVPCDVADPAQLDRLYAQAEEFLGRIDLLFANAGIAEFRPATQVDPAFFDRMMAINCRGAFFTVTQAHRWLADGAAVVINGTGLTCKGLPGSAVYSMSKAALVSLARTLAAEWAPRRIRVCVVSPGPIDTPLHARLGLPPQRQAEMERQIAAKVPLQRFGTAQEVADAVLFVAGNSYVNGCELFVDGGFAQV